MARAQFYTPTEETQTPLYRVSTAATAVVQETKLNPVIPTFHKAALHAQQKHQKKQTQRPARKRFTSRLKKRLALATVVLVGGFTLRWIQATQEPLWPQTKAEKAFFTGTHNAMQGPNAAHFYAAAADALHTESALELSGMGKAESLSLVQQKEALAKNALAMKLLREGLNYKFQGKNTYSVKGFQTSTLSTPVTNLMAQRALARLLATEAYLQSLDGNAAAAVSSGLDTLRFGTDIGHGARLVETMTGNLVQDLGLKTAATYAESLTAEEASAALARLDAMPPPLTYTEVLEQAKHMEMSDLRELFQDAFQDHQLTSQGNLAYTATLWWEGKQAIVDSVAAYYDQHLQRAALPLEQVKQLPPIPVPRDAFSELLLPNVEQLRESLEKTAAQRLALRSRLLAASLRHK